MAFGLSEEQRLFDTSLRGVLAARVTQAARQAAAEAAGDGTFDAVLWTALTELGLPGLLLPEAAGGAGLGLADAALAAEALGYHAAPTPFLSSAVLAPLALRHLGDPAAQAEWLPALAAGRMRVAFALGALAGGTGSCTLRRDGERLSGEVAPLVEAGGATHALLALPRDGRGEGLALLALDAPGVALRPRPGLDRLRPLAALSLSDAPARLLPGDAAPVLDAGRVILAAETLGAAQAMLDQAVAYAGQRRQFGRAIASFQGVKHVCAEMAAWLEPCHAFLRHAAAAQDAARAGGVAEARMLACQVKAHLDEVGRDVARHATEVHGGMGFTELLGLPFWFKRIAGNRQLLGGPERCREEAAMVQGFAA
ncbi:acyl-CoA dehydrogenase family protein [Roseicella sp. DB1501]|uniref:acyl-CoA dehydrogenase family protein n=1 Tax=Roseicella sp. DB1501 TaxID=2730925 RepID=UPI00149226D5|nr:acyl-CoA dehydrogenase family protein [Roseicella sp. DB1501]NOG69583.1 acyl-CoA dehydrogenase [Roseicella sp. DB1501]